MNFNDLSPIERLAYEAGRAEALADRWRTDADLDQRDGKPSAIARRSQRYYETEAADAWRRLATLKGEEHAQAKE